MGSSPIEVRQSRDTRLNIRVTSAEAELIRHAAAVTGKSVTEFLVDNATQAAEQVLLDRRVFQVADLAWQEFQEALDRPAVFKPRLNELLNADPFVD